MIRPAPLVVPLSTAGVAAAASPTGQGRPAGSVPGARTTWQGHSLANNKPRTAASAVVAGLGEPASAAPCQSGTCQSVEERQRLHQRHMHQRAAAAAATGRAYHAMLEQRERQRAAVAEEHERQRSVWAAAAASAMRSRHVPGPRPHNTSAGSSGAGSKSGRPGPMDSSRPSGGACRAAATAAAPSVRAAAAPPGMRPAPPSSPAGFAAAGGGQQASQGPQLRDARFWMLYTLQWNRLYEDANSDDLWGQGFGAAAAAAKQQGGPAGSAPPGIGMPADEFWREFVRESARGWRFQGGYGAGAQQAQQRQQQQAHQQQQQAQQQQGAVISELGAAAGSLEQEVRAELARLLAAAGGDLLRFIAALGVAFEPAADRGAALRNARTAFLLRLHPDRLRQAGEREQLQGLLATQVFNSLWATERGRS